MRLCSKFMPWAAVVIAGMLVAGCGSSSGAVSNSTTATTTGCQAGSAGSSDTVTTPQEPAAGVSTITGSCWAKIASTPITLAVLHPPVPSNFSANFKTAWSTDGVYIRVSVHKWPLYNNANATDWWDDDTVEFYLSGSNNRAGSYKAIPGTAQLGVTNLGILEDGTNGASFSGAKASVHVNSGIGYVAELFVPWSNLDTTGTVGHKLGFDVAVDVANSTGAHRTAQVAWTGSSSNFATDVGFGTMTLS